MCGHSSHLILAT